MPIDPQIPLMGRPAPSPVEVIQQGQALQQGTQQLQLGQMKLLQEQRAMQAQQALDQAFQGAVKVDPTSGQPQIDEGQLFSHVPGHLVPGLMESFAKTKKSIADLQEAQGKVEILRADLLGNMAATVKSSNYDLQTFVRGVKVAQVKELITPQRATELVMRAIEDPSTIQTTTNQLLAGSPKQRELATAAQTADARQRQAATGETRLTIEAPGMAARAAAEQADAVIKGQVAAGMQGGITAEQRQQNATRQQEMAISAGHLAVARQRLAQEVAAPDLTPQGLDAVALGFAKSGQLPPMGMGKKAVELRTKIINRAAEMQPGLDVATAKADFAANEGSLKAIQKQRDAVVSFEQTANKNLDTFLQTAKGVIDTGSPMLNAPMRAAASSVFGSQNKAAFDAARLVAQNEIAKVTSNPNLSGQLSDAARKEVESVMSPNATLKQIYAVAKVLRSDMGARHQSLDEQIAAIQGRIKQGGSQGAPTAPTATHRFNPATGKIEAIR